MRDRQGKEERKEGRKEVREREREGGKEETTNSEITYHTKQLHLLSRPSTERPSFLHSTCPYGNSTWLVLLFQHTTARNLDGEAAAVRLSPRGKEVGGRG